MVTSSLYQPVRARTGVLSEQVAHQILDLITSRDLEVNDQLPPLHELTGYLGVSRTAVREAIKLLDAWGILTVKHGVGTFVAGLPEEALTVPLRVSATRSGESVQNLLQVREALEPHIAALAARNAQPEHIAEMETAVRTMDESLEHPDAYIPADLAFHTALARATGNDLFLVVIRPIIDLFNEAMTLSVRTSGATERAQQYHRLLLEHIKARRIDMATEVMRAHLEDVRRNVQSQLDVERQSARHR